MKRYHITLIVIAVLAALIIWAAPWNAARVAGLKIYKQGEPSEILTTAAYADEYVDVRVAKVGDTYVVAFSIANEGFDTIYYQREQGMDSTSNLFTALGSCTDEVPADQLATIKMSVYSKGGIFIKRPVRTYGFGELTGIEEYESVAAARAALGIS